MPDTASQAKVAVSDVGTEIRRIFADIMEIHESRVAMDVPLADLGVDSLMALEVIARIEKKYRIEIPEEAIERVRTLNDTLALVHEYL